MHVVINVFRKVESKICISVKERQRIQREKSTEMLNSSKAELKKGKILITTCVVGERRIRGEVVAKAAVDCIRVRMPE